MGVGVCACSSQGPWCCPRLLLLSHGPVAVAVTCPCCCCRHMALLLLLLLLLLLSLHGLRRDLGTLGGANMGY
jgi:hypothetical protein